MLITLGLKGQGCFSGRQIKVKWLLIVQLKSYSMLYGFVMILLPIKQYATLLVLRPNKARIGQPCSRSFKGHVVPRGLDLSRCCARCRAKKASQIIFKVVCLQSFFLSMIGRRD